VSKATQNKILKLFFHFLFDLPTVTFQTHLQNFISISYILTCANNTQFTVAPLVSVPDQGTHPVLYVDTAVSLQRSSGSVQENSMSNLYDSWRSEWNGYYYNAYYGNGNAGSSASGYSRRRSDYDTNFWTAPTWRARNVCFDWALVKFATFKSFNTWDVYSKNHQ
jgi:hypothetical protein